MLCFIISLSCWLPPCSADANPALKPLESLPEKTIDLSEKYTGYDAAFVIVNESTGVVERFNAKRCAARLGPCSTFKVPHAVIGLDAGVLTDENHFFKWDGKKRWRAVLNRDHTLATAMQDSVLWYFQRVAKSIGDERMRAGLKALDYGNQDMSSGLQTFWLNQSLKISADEQVEFIRRLRTEKLPFSKRAQQITKKVITLESTNDYTLAGKTGTAASDNNEQMILGWFVGYVERGEDTHVFACNIAAEDNASGWQAKKLVLEVLRDRGVLPAKRAVKSQGNGKLSE